MTAARIAAAWAATCEAGAAFPFHVERFQAVAESGAWYPMAVTSIKIPPDFWKWLALALLMAFGGWIAREIFQGPEKRAAAERSVMTDALAEHGDSIERLETAIVALTAAGRIPVYSVPEAELSGRCTTVNADVIGALLRGEGSRSDAVAVERCRDEMVALTERLRQALRASAGR